MTFTRDEVTYRIPYSKEVDDALKRVIEAQADGFPAMERLTRLEMFRFTLRDLQYAARDRGRPSRQAEAAANAVGFDIVQARVAVLREAHAAVEAGDRSNPVAAMILDERAAQA